VHARSESLFSFHTHTHTLCHPCTFSSHHHMQLFAFSFSHTYFASLFSLFHHRVRAFSVSLTKIYTCILLSSLQRLNLCVCTSLSLTPSLFCPLNVSLSSLSRTLLLSLSFSLPDTQSLFSRPSPHPGDPSLHSCVCLCMYACMCASCSYCDATCQKQHWTKGIHKHM